MPRPIPPPPPLPSVEETRLAVRQVYRVVLAAVAMFLLWSRFYSPEGFFVSYGREGGQSWMRHKAATLDEVALRAHPGGRVAWLVGSSIMRDSFDEIAINQSLEMRGSEWRVAKFGQTRGAAGMSAGMLRFLPLREGDLVVHNVAMENFRRDWLEFSELPAERVSLMLKPSWFWTIKGWTLADKLEQAVAIPWDFYRTQTQVMVGVEAWLQAPFAGRLPHPRRRSFHLSHRKVQHEDLSKLRAQGERSRYWMGPDDVDLARDQFNQLGLRRMQERCDEVGASLLLVDVPPRQEYQASFLHDHVRAVWDAWRLLQTTLSYAPQQPEDAYYDMKHPNDEGRAALSAWMVRWLDGGRPRGEPTPLSWPVPAYNHSEVPPPPIDQWNPWTP